jgi:hypothetical protein
MSRRKHIPTGLGALRFHHPVAVLNISSVGRGLPYLYLDVASRGNSPLLPGNREGSERRESPQAKRFRLGQAWWLTPVILGT